MPTRDDYAMFCYGVLFNNNEIAEKFVEAHPNLNLQMQSLGKIVYEENNDYAVVYIQNAETTVGSRTGSMVQHMDITCAPRDLQLNFEGQRYTFSWILIMWGPTRY